MSFHAMRDDFHKIVIERPRWGSSLSNRKTGWSTRHYIPERDDDQPSFGRPAWAWKHSHKSFSDRLGPLERFLGKQVGRPWRKVEGEFRKALDLRTVIGRHLWDHAERMVELRCRLEDRGRPVRLDGYPLFCDFFVHPRSGLLLRTPPERRDRARERRKRIADTLKVSLDGRTRAEKIGGFWFLFLDEGRTEEVVEVRCMGGKEVALRVRRPVLRKKQANTREIQRILSAVETSIP